VLCVFCFCASFLMHARQRGELCVYGSTTIFFCLFLCQTGLACLHPMCVSSPTYVCPVGVTVTGSDCDGADTLWSVCTHWSPLMTIPYPLALFFLLCVCLLAYILLPSGAVFAYRVVHLLSLVHPLAVVHGVGVPFCQHAAQAPTELHCAIAGSIVPAAAVARDRQRTGGAWHMTSRPPSVDGCLALA
jgi:hypothetical protein